MPGDLRWTASSSEHAGEARSVQTLATSSAKSERDRDGDRRRRRCGRARARGGRASRGRAARRSSARRPRARARARRPAKHRARRPPLQTKRKRFQSAPMRAACAPAGASASCGAGNERRAALGDARCDRRRGEDDDAGEALTASDLHLGLGSGGGFVVGRRPGRFALVLRAARRKANRRGSARRPCAAGRSSSARRRRAARPGRRGCGRRTTACRSAGPARWSRRCRPARCRRATCRPSAAAPMPPPPLGVAAVAVVPAEEALALVHREGVVLVVPDGSGAGSWPGCERLAAPGSQAAARPRRIAVAAAEARPAIWKLALLAVAAGQAAVASMTNATRRCSLIAGSRPWCRAARGEHPGGDERGTAMRRGRSTRRRDVRARRRAHGAAVSPRARPWRSRSRTAGRHRPADAPG